ncbi:DUF6346 domain-containing protein [Saccharopolyspora sp. NPDC002686]|uniref:DUF6346 domain-containing protein n=1 Tax=Saccharopolyspora sp. NPDC002686 TaxID=3154541 RepID=UPI00331825F8
MWKSDNIAIRLAKMLGGFVVVAIIVLSWLTIVFSFPEKHDRPNGTAYVQSCEDTGPITRRGFGHNWSCTATIRDDKTGNTWTQTLDMNFFSPDDIGKEKRLTWGYGGGRSNINTEKRTYTPAEGYSTGFTTTISVVSFIVLLPPALWMLATSVMWSFSQAEQRKFWEKIHGTPEERAAKKRKELAEREARQASRQRYAAIKEARRKAKEERRSSR